MGDRHDERSNDQLRPYEIVRNYTEMAAGSALITMGKTKVLCTASVEEKVPPWMRGSGKGWVTAEYSLLPGSSPERVPREAVKGKQSGRTQEIQRLIGRALRSVCDLRALGEVQIVVDCDVLQADGGTRTASITGAYTALYDAIAKIGAQKSFRISPLISKCAAISVGVVKGEVVVDLDYQEDSKAEVDMNIVMNSYGEFIEIQGSAEGSPFTKSQLVEMIKLGESAITELLEYQHSLLGL